LTIESEYGSQWQEPSLKEESQFWPRISRAAKFATPVFGMVAIGGTEFVASPASAAYNGQTAANYADTWAGGFNPDYQYETAYSSPTDCTDFASQAIKAGGLPWSPQTYPPANGYYSNPSYWWGTTYEENQIWNIDPTWTYTWTAVQNNYNYIVNSGTGVEEGSFGYYEGQRAPSNALDMVPGDLLYYNWDAEQNNQGTSGINHMTVVIADNTSSTDGAYGTVIDSHDDPRYHVFWTLKFVTNPTNPYVNTEAVYKVHL